MISFKFLILCLLSWNGAFANWNPAARKIILEESQNYKSFGKAGFSTYWGGIRRRFSPRENKGLHKSIKLPGLMEKDLEVYFYENKGSQNLHIFFPGVFGSLESEITKSVIRNIEMIGESVLVIPNFFAVEYLKSKPIYGNQSMRTDILIPLKVIDRFKKNYNRFHLYAESLGSFTGASVIARLSNREEMKNKKIDITFMWPPIEIKNALTHFDKNIVTTKKMFDDCSLIVNTVKTLYYFTKEFYPKNMDKDYLECMDALLYHSNFVKSMNNSFEESALFKDEIQIETFFEFLKYHRPDLYKNVKENDEQTTLKYWLNKRNPKTTTVRFVSSSDDFLNLTKSWDLFLKEVGLKEDSLILLPWGAHSGPLGMPIWDQAFKANMK